MDIVRPALVLLALLPVASAQLPADLQQLDGAWYRVVEGVRFPVEDVLSVRLLPGVKLADATAAASLPALQLLRSSPRAVLDLKLPAGADPVAAAQRLLDTGAFEFVDVNASGRYVGVPNDPQFPQQWNLNNVGQGGGLVGADVDAVAAWDISGGDPSVVVAVIDSGSEITHSDLAANVWTNPDEVAGNGLDDDGNGFIDDVHGWDFEANNNNPDGGFFHGTAVAGVIAARGNNGLGIAGLAGGGSGGPGCRVLPCNSGSFAPNASVLDDAVLYAMGEGVRVITLSLQVPTTQALTDALATAQAAGVFIDCAAGNNGGSVSYPATLPSVMAVACTNKNDVKSGFSNAGPQVQVSAPGESVLMLSTGNGFTTDSGTSFSAPHVAALAALIFSVNPALTNVQARQILMDSADDIGPPGYDTGTGFGRINAAAALALASGGVLGSVTAYGAGLPGGNGVVPLIAGTGGTPKAGNAGFGISLRRAGVGLTAWLPLSLAQATLPFKGGTLLVDPLALLALPVAVVGADGGALMPLPLPADPQIAGLVFDGQWLVHDPSAVADWALSAGVQVTVGG
jgi:subtilisin family serine protease